MQPLYSPLRGIQYQHRYRAVAKLRIARVPRIAQADMSRYAHNGDLKVELEGKEELDGSPCRKEVLYAVVL